jgi:arylsulfatase A-like enzyme
MRAVHRISRTKGVSRFGAVIAASCLIACASAPPPPVPVAPPALPQLASIPVLREQQSRVIICVWDGLRADALDAGLTPNLAALRSRGVVFSDHHATYPTVTMMNAASLATGAYPDRTAYFGNTMWLPTASGVDRAGNPLPFHAPVFTEDYWVLQGLNDSTRGLLATETLFSAAKKAGLRTATVGKSGPALMQDLSKADLILDERVVWPVSFAQELKSRGFALPATAPKVVDIELRPDNGDPTAAGPRKTFADGVTSDPSDASGTPYLATNRYLLDVFTDGVLELHAPAISVLWLRNPDSTQHVYGPGTKNSKDALASQDALLGRLLERLEALDLLQHTDLFIVSDHGHSSVSGPLDLFPLRGVSLGPNGERGPGEVQADGFSVSGDVRLAHELTRAGIPAFDGMGCIYNPVLSGTLADGNPLHPTNIDTDGSVCGEGAGKKYTTPAYRLPQSGLPPKSVVVAVNGGSDYIYCPDRDPETIARVVRFLQAGEEYGPIFLASRYGSLPGTLPLSWVNLENASSAPDIIFSYNFDEEAIIQGVRGTSFQSANPYNSRGTHGSFSARDVHATLIAMGPHFRAGFVDYLPSGNVDLAVTIAAIFGLPLSTGSGRVLSEAMLGLTQPAYSVTSAKLAPALPATGLSVRRANGQATAQTSYSFELAYKELRAAPWVYRYFDGAKAQRQ